MTFSHNYEEKCWHWNNFFKEKYRKKVKKTFKIFRRKLQSLGRICIQKLFTTFPFIHLEHEQFQFTSRCVLESLKKNIISNQQNLPVHYTVLGGSADCLFWLYIYIYTVWRKSNIVESWCWQEIIVPQIQATFLTWIDARTI